MHLTASFSSLGYLSISSEKSLYINFTKPDDPSNLDEDSARLGRNTTLTSCQSLYSE